MAKNKKPPIHMSPGVEMCLKGFKPIFMSEEDEQILKQLGKIKKRLGEINSQEYRKLLHSGGSMTPKMKEIRLMEISLMRAIRNRNIL